MSKYLPFDLETALKNPERVVTRDGQKVLMIVRLPIPKSSGETIVAQNQCGLITTLFYDGKFFSSGKKDDSDLFLLPEPAKTVEYWENIYRHENGSLCIVSGYFTKELADSQAGSTRFACVKVTAKKGEGL